MITVLITIAGILVLGALFGLLVILFAPDIDPPPVRHDPFKWGHF